MHSLVNQAMQGCIFRRIRGSAQAVDGRQPAAESLLEDLSVSLTQPGRAHPHPANQVGIQIQGGLELHGLPYYQIPISPASDAQTPPEPYGAAERLFACGASMRHLMGVLAFGLSLGTLEV
jgi:hypothetical protein